MLNSFASHHFASALFWPLDGGPGVPLPRLVQNLTLARQPQTFGPSVFTYRDLIDRVLLFANAGPGSEQFPEYCVAVEEAYRVVFQSRKWRSMLRMLTINYEQPQGTYPDGSGGTVSYTNSTRTMTLTGATWPSWVQYATIRIGDEAVYTVDGVIDANNILLGVNTNPGQDLAAGTPYQCFRAIYTLPPDFLKLYMPEQNVLFWKCRYVEPNQWYSLTSHLGVASTPFLCTIMSDPKLIGSYAIYFYPFPVCDGPGNSAGGIYLAAPQNIRVTGYSPNDYTGTISGTSGSATITGVGTNFSAQYIGSIFRPSANTTLEPTGTSGPNAYPEQAVVVAVSSSTSLTLDQNLQNNYTNTKFAISDPIDMPVSMIQAVIDMARFIYARNRPNSGLNIQMLQQTAATSLKQCQENDTVVLAGERGPYIIDRMQRDVPAPFGGFFQ